MKKILFNFLSCITLCLAPCTAISQSITDPVLKNYVHDIDQVRRKLPIEKLYLQLDKPYYTLNDTIHFKCYLLDADYLTPSKRSGLLYLELDNLNNKPVKRIMIPVVSGVSWGDIPLDEKDISEGSYTIRAYTNWMQNFGEDYIFKKSIYISSTRSASTLVQASFKLDSVAGKAKIQATIRFLTLDKNPVVLKDMRMIVMNGQHIQARDNLSTGVDGSVGFNFTLNDKTLIKNLTIRALQRGRGADTDKLSIPVILNRPEKTDLQFMPESGNLVAGIKTKIGFKAINEDGEGTTITGSIFNSTQQQVATFQSVHNGMGAVEFTPDAGEKYYAKVILKNGVTKTYSLPTVNPAGTVLRIEPRGSDSLELTINATPNLPSVLFYLIAQAKGVACYATTINLNKGMIRKVLPKTLFPTGIARFTLFNATNQPLNERLVYINRNNDLDITIMPEKANYSTRDSIALTLQVKDKTGKPVQGTFSLAVTDDNQVNTDKTGGNFINTMLFTSDLKGNIEEPGYYFENNTKEREAELDNLLLTQGWVGYSWAAIFDTKKASPKFAAEKEFTIQGKVTNIFNKPVKKAAITLFRKYPLLVTDTVTDDEGRFNFKGNKYLPTDSVFFFITAKHKNGNNFNMGIDINEFKPPEFAPSTITQLPWYVNSDTVLLNNSHTKVAQQKAESKYLGEGKVLKEVNINQKKLISGSQNPSPELDNIIWDEKDMAAAKKMTLMEILEHKYKTVVKIGNLGYFTYMLDAHYIVVLTVDGIRANTDFYLDYLTAEDIKGVEIRYFLTERYDYAYIYVTTYGSAKHIPGTYAYKPIPFTRPIKFYRPAYTVTNKNIAPGTDMRSTIHWEPNIITDKDGKANVSFFSADKSGTYTVIAEGTDLQGNIGSQQTKIKADLKQDL